MFDWPGATSPSRPSSSSACPASSSRRPSGPWPIFLLGAMLLGTLQVLADEAPPAEAAMGVPIESLILPAVAAVACLGAIRLVPFGLWLAPALLITWLLVGRTLALEARINAAPEGLTADDRTAVLVTILLVGFLAFTGIAAMVPGGLVQPAADGAAAAGDEPAGPRRRRRDRRVPARLPGGLAAGRQPARCALERPDLRGRHRHRGRRAAGDGDPAAHRAGPADPALLPLGRVRRLGAVPAARRRLALADRPARRSWASRSSPGTCSCAAEARLDPRASSSPRAFDDSTRPVLQD